MSTTNPPVGTEPSSRTLALARILHVASSLTDEELEAFALTIENASVQEEIDPAIAKLLVERAQRADEQRKKGPMPGLQEIDEVFQKHI